MHQYFSRKRTNKYKQWWNM